MARNIRRTKYKFKWTKELVFLIIGILAIAATTIILSLPSSLDKLRNKWSSASLSEETVIREISEKDLIAEIGKNSGYVFVFYGTPLDETSKTNIAKIDNVAQKYGVEVVYWLDASEIYETDEDTKATKDFKDKIDQKEADLQVADLLVYGTFFTYKDGKNVSDTSDMDGVSFDVVINQQFGNYKSDQA